MNFLKFWNVAQKCSFPFTYNNIEHNDCVTEGNLNWCSPTAVFNGQKLECLDNTVADSCSSEFNPSCAGTANVAKNSVKFTNCQVPTVSNVSPLTVNFETDITISGSDFSSTQCENEVYIGGKKCSIKSQSTGSITCQIGENSTLVPNRHYDIEIMKKNVGFALQNNFYQINFQSIIKSIDPQSGSTTGGTKITIDGDGFTQDTFVVIGQNVFNRNNAQIDYNSITLITQPDQGLQNISVYSNNKPAICSGICNFEFNSANSPVIDSVSPTTVSQRTDLTIDGQNFDNQISLVKVKVGNQNCQVTSSTINQIMCTLDGLDLGLQNINLNIESKIF